MDQIRVLVADEQAIPRAGLRMLIGAQDDMAVVGEAMDAADLVRQATELRPHVAVIDIAMPTGCIQVIDRIGRELPDTRIVVLTTEREPEYVRAALAAGTAGYVLKTATHQDLMAAIRAVHQSRYYVDRELANVVNHVFVRQQTAPRGGRAPLPGTLLTARERQVLQLLAIGYTNQHAADRLFLSVKTIECHRTRIGQKLGLRTRADIFRYALELGILPLELPSNPTQARTSEPTGPVPVAVGPLHSQS